MAHFHSGHGGIKQSMVACNSIKDADTDNLQKRRSVRMGKDVLLQRMGPARVAAKTWLTLFEHVRAGPAGPSDG